MPFFGKKLKILSPFSQKPFVFHEKFREWQVSFVQKRNKRLCFCENGNRETKKYRSKQGDFVESGRKQRLEIILILR